MYLLLAEFARFDAAAEHRPQGLSGVQRPTSTASTDFTSFVTARSLINTALEIPEDLSSGEQGRTSQSIPVVEQSGYQPSQSIPVVEQLGYSIPRTSQSGLVFFNNVVDLDQDSASDGNTPNLDPALSHNAQDAFTFDDDSGSDEGQAQQDGTSVPEPPPAFIESQQKRTKFFHTYKERMQKTLFTLGSKTGCYGFLYLKR